MTPLETAQRYFAAWNRRDAAGVLATLGDRGTYADPLTGGPIRGDAFAGYMNGLFASFPDLSFEVASAGLAAPDLVAAQWVMRGTNTGSMMGLPPTGRRVEVTGADFIQVAGEAIQSVTGYFDSRAVPDQLGLQVVIQPHAIGPFAFGVATRAWTGGTARPGAFSITVIQARSPADAAEIRERGQAIITELLPAPGLLGVVAATIGDRQMTISAWDGPESPRQVMKAAAHGEAAKRFHGGGLAAGGFTSVFVPERINTMWVRCTACDRMTDADAAGGACACGATLPRPMAYW